MAKRYYSSAALATTLASPITNSATSVTVTALTGYPAQTPWTAVLDYDTTDEEIVEVTNVNSLTLTITRGVDGTTAKAHSAGAGLRHGVSARDFQEVNDYFDATASLQALTSQFYV